ncbi:hypothetical protein MHUMG1_08874 [Metarhizium humberi]|uniref:Uncharacterized protein n=1 Tax=Metarhizium humberi TaxID=2596975 RepID=A0A9P8S469_9HYPO|nr:hypothetical protein MHUMG1_08874 [Metarhizium humberi]
MHNKTEPSQTMAPETCSASNFGPEISVVDLTGAFHLETRSDQQGCFARPFPSTYCVSHDNSLTPEDRRPQQKTLVVWVNVVQRHLASPSRGTNHGAHRDGFDRLVQTMTCGDLLLSALRDSPPPFESISPTDAAAPVGITGSKAGGKGNAVGVYQASRLAGEEKPTAT